jgi:hypothetical protein
MEHYKTHFGAKLCLYDTLINSDLPEILNGDRRLADLRYLVLAAVAPVDPSAVTKTEFSLVELREIAERLRLAFGTNGDWFRQPIGILEKTLAPKNLVRVTERKGKPRFFYSITENGVKEVVRRIERLQAVAQVVELKRKMISGKVRRVEKVVLPKSVVHLCGDSLSVDDLDVILDELIRELELQTNVKDVIPRSQSAPQISAPMATAGDSISP